MCVGISPTRPGRCNAVELPAWNDANRMLRSPPANSSPLSLLTWYGFPTGKLEVRQRSIKPLFSYENTQQMGIGGSPSRREPKSGRWWRARRVFEYK